jgi:hypothetical protein
LLATAALAVGAVAGAGGPVAARPSTTPLNGWTQLSTGTVGIIQNIGLARFGSALQAVWVQDNSDSTQTLVTRSVDGSGSPTTASLSVASGWGSLNEFPAILANGDQRVIAFSGIQDANSANPYSQGYQYYLTSADGSSWTLANGTLNADSMAYGSYGTDAVDAGGTPVTGFTSGTAGMVSYHSGFVTPIPASSTGDPTTTAEPCCAYDTGLGYDAASGTTWTAWYSNSGQQTTDGILAQQIEPSLGTRIQAPGSTLDYSGSISSVDPGQRIVVAPRVGGGVFAAYFQGYPSPTKVALWKLGATSALVRPGGDVGRVGVAAGPGGRMWLYWWDTSSDVVHAARTNPAVTTLGAVCSVATPGKTTDVWDLVGNAGQGPLQLFANAGEPNAQIYDTVVQPCLSVSVSPSKLSAATGGTVTVAVSDAGAPVSGAKVGFLGHHETTPASGKVKFTVPKHHSKGSFPVAVAHAGYEPAGASVRIR